MPEISIIIPCLNEAATIAACIGRAQDFFKNDRAEYEILVVDNGSCDGSAEIARNAGASVVFHPVRGYGEALRAGMAAARGRFLVLGDADDSYHFDEMGSLIQALRGGDDFVVGNRFRGGIEEGAMPWLHRYFGNPLLSLIGRLLFGLSLGDFHCGLRGLTKEAFVRLSLKSPGMELASEMLAKAAFLRLKVAEVPVRLYRDGRGARGSHLRSWTDGWRHLKCMLALRFIKGL